MTGQTKNIGLRVWNDGLFQSWLLLRLQIFLTYLNYELMKGKLMAKKEYNSSGKWICKEEETTKLLG
jgi:hypothetical protein